MKTLLKSGVFFCHEWQKVWLSESRIGSGQARIWVDGMIERIFDPPPFDFFL
jgi:hypothetical protein